MALTGLGAVGFVAVHLIGNLTLLSANPDYFNTYAKGLHDLGPELTLMEIGLVVLFALHVVTAVTLKKNHKDARPIGYQVHQTKGGQSKLGLSSKYMAVSGSALLVFLILHIIHFRFGPNIAEGYVTAVKGAESRDLYRLVSEAFHNPGAVAIYLAAMVFLGFHLRHAFWSAFQSLGLMHPKYSKGIYAFGLFLAIVLSVGFMVIPLWMYFDCSGVVK